MGVLTYSALNKINKLLKDQYSDVDSSKIISKEVSVSFNEINIGNSFLLNLGELPANCVLIHSQAIVNTIFKDSGNHYPKMSVGIENVETAEVNFPVANQRLLIFKDFILNSAGTYTAQGTLFNSTPKMINSNINNLIVEFRMIGIWTVGGSLNTARDHAAGLGSQTAGLCAGGYNGSFLASSEEYNGTSWSYGGALATARRQFAGCGSQNAGLSFGGNGPSNVTEEYNGTSWSGGGNLNTARTSLGGCGTQNAGLSFGGTTGSLSTVTEEYNGTNWTVSGPLNTARYYLAGCGTQTAGLSFGGYSTISLASTEEYNGTNWEIGNNLITARDGLVGAGTQTAGLNFTGLYTAKTELYDGTNWSSGGNTNMVLDAASGCGTQTAGLCFGGLTSSFAYTTNTEEYDAASLSSLTQGSLNLYVSYAY